MKPHKWAKEIKNLIERLDYVDGKLFWKIPPKNHPSLLGKEAGSIDSHGYRQIHHSGKNIFTHHIVWLMFNDDMPEQIDHIDRNRLNNRIENLRPATNMTNQHNAGIRKDNTSGYTGITFKKETEQWNVRIQTNGKRYNIGTYDDLAGAIDAHNMAKGKYRAETQMV